MFIYFAKLYEYIIFTFKNTIKNIISNTSKNKYITNPNETHRDLNCCRVGL